MPSFSSSFSFSFSFSFLIPLLMTAFMASPLPLLVNSVIITSSKTPPLYEELSPEIAPLLPSSGGALPTTGSSNIPTIPSSPSPPNPDAFDVFGPDSGLAPSGSLRDSLSVPSCVMGFNNLAVVAGWLAFWLVRLRIMTTQLLEIQCQELKFTFELNKQSSCSLLLSNKSDHYIAFKVKTTSPKKYCVRPNLGIIKPKATCDFTVIMQAQRVAPFDLQCKDKFLIQSTAVPFGTAEKDISSDMFAKDSGIYIEETKLRVVFASPLSSAVLLPINGEQKQDTCRDISSQKDRVLTGVENLPPPHIESQDSEGIESINNAEIVGKARNVDDLNTTKDDESFQSAKDTDELKAGKDAQLFPVENMNLLKPSIYVLDQSKPMNDDMEQLKPLKDAVEQLKQPIYASDQLKHVIDDMEQLKPLNDAVEQLKQPIYAADQLKHAIDDMEHLKPLKDTAEQLKPLQDAVKPPKNAVELLFSKDFEELKLELKVKESKLREAKLSIKKMQEERSMTNREKENLRQELEALRKNNPSVSRTQVGFPLLHVCIVILISLAVGYFSHF